MDTGLKVYFADILGWRTPADALDERLHSHGQAVLRRPVESAVIDEDKEVFA